MAVMQARDSDEIGVQAPSSTIPQRAPTGSPGRGILLAVFFLSGVSSLIYQVAWFRLLALIFGVTSFALGVVLAAFMGGLALGALLGGWLAVRTSRPLRAYALAE